MTRPATRSRTADRLDRALSFDGADSLPSGSTRKKLIEGGLSCTFVRIVRDPPGTARDAPINEMSQEKVLGTTKV